MAAPKKAEVQEALRLINEEGVHPYEAAKRAGANRFSVYSALRKAADVRPPCPACGQLLKPGQVLKAPPPIFTITFEAAAPVIAEHARRYGWPATQKKIMEGK